MVVASHTVRASSAARTNPKGRLTSLQTLANFAAPPLTRGLPHSYEILAAASEGAAEADLGALRDHAITTVEELVGLAHVDRRFQTSFIQELGVSSTWVDNLEVALAETRAGAEELEDWQRYEQYEYAYGLDLGETEEPGPPTQEEHETSSALLGAPATSPTGVNWIDSNMPPIRDQLDRGTCTAFASVVCLEYHLGIRSGAPQDLSEQFQYWNMVQATGQHNLVACFPLLRNQGVCREETWRYYGKEIAGNDAQSPAPANASGEASNYRCTEVLRISARSVTDVQEALAARHLVAIGIPVYRSWMSNPVVRKYGNITLPMAGEVPERVGHAVALVGFEDDDDFAGGGYFIVRNSWNHHWGTENPFGSGYGTLPYRYIERFNWDAWCILK